MTTYTDYQWTMATAKSREAGKPIDNNTRLMDRGDHFAVRLHATDVVDIYPDHYIVRTGGWQTVTTKDRINKALRQAGVQVYSVRGEWRIGRWSDAYATAIPFVEGMRIEADGTLPQPPKGEAETARLAHELARKATAKFISGFAKAVRDGEVEEPSTGDCFYCQYGLENAGHVISHFEEGYYVPTILWAAVAERAGNAGVVWSMIRQRRDGKWAAQLLRSYFKRHYQAALVEHFTHEARRTVRAQMTA